MNTFTDSNKSNIAPCESIPSKNNQCCHFYCLFINVKLFRKSVYVPALSDNNKLSQARCQNLTSIFSCHKKVNICFSDVLRGYRKGILPKMVQNLNLLEIFSKIFKFGKRSM